LKIFNLQISVFISQDKKSLIDGIAKYIFSSYEESLSQDSTEQPFLNPFRTIEETTVEAEKTPPKTTAKMNHNSESQEINQMKFELYFRHVFNFIQTSNKSNSDLTKIFILLVDNINSQAILPSNDLEELASTVSQLFVFQCLSNSFENITCPNLKILLEFWKMSSCGKYKVDLLERLKACVCPPVDSICSSLKYEKPYIYCDFIERVFGEKLEKKLELSSEEFNSLSIIFPSQYLLSKNANKNDLCKSIVYNVISGNFLKIRFVNLRIIIQIFGISNRSNFSFDIFIQIRKFVFSNIDLGLVQNTIQSHCITPVLPVNIPTPSGSRNARLTERLLEKLKERNIDPDDLSFSYLKNRVGGSVHKGNFEFTCALLVSDFQRESGPLIYMDDSALSHLFGFRKNANSWDRSEYLEDFVLDLPSFIPIIATIPTNPNATVVKFGKKFASQLIQKQLNTTRIIKYLSFQFDVQLGHNNPIEGNLQIFCYNVVSMIMSRRITSESLYAAELKEICTQLGLQTNGIKEDLFNRITNFIFDMNAPQIPFIEFVEDDNSDEEELQELPAKQLHSVQQQLQQPILSKQPQEIENLFQNLNISSLSSSNTPPPYGKPLSTLNPKTEEPVPIVAPLIEKVPNPSPMKFESFKFDLYPFSIEKERELKRIPETFNFSLPPQPSPQKVFKPKSFVQNIQRIKEIGEKETIEQSKKTCWEDIFLGKDYSKCPICHSSDIKYVGTGNTFNQCHIIPNIKGGPKKSWNLLPGCGCNQNMSTKHLIDWMGTDGNKKKLLKPLLCTKYKALISPVDRCKEDRDQLIIFVQELYGPQEMDLYREWLILLDDDLINIHKHDG